MDDSVKQFQRISDHKFDGWAADLMEKPYIFSEWEKTQVGENNDGSYRQEYQKLPIKDNSEELVNCGDYGLVSKDYYLNVYLDEITAKKEKLLDQLQNRNLYPFAWLRKSIATKLRKVDLLLRLHGLFLVINSGWRDTQTQTDSKKLMSKEFGNKYVDKAIASVSVSPHSTGGACDLELWSLQTGCPLSYSYPGDIINSFVLEQKQQLNEINIARMKMRRILFHLLTAPEFDFVAHPGEFWHFGDGDQLSAYLKKQKFAKFGYIKPPTDFKFHGN
ncbi:MAG: hypothetical protein G01um101416_140 [Microgenomates group bacterium Gr01-1014_16]|nr:MAG: hypothetical protein G01um101416_140 [Microgenomates group bacterium Gr01-1014_16]